MYTKKIIEALGFGDDDLITIYKTGDNSGKKYRIYFIYESHLMANLEENYKNNNKSYNYCEDLYYSTIEKVPEFDKRLQDRRESLRLPCVLNSTDTILFGADTHCRLAVNYTITEREHETNDNANPTDLTHTAWGRADMVEVLLELSSARVNSRHVLLFTSSPTADDVKALLVADKILTHADDLPLDEGGLIADYYRAQGPAIVLPHAAAKYCLPYLPAQFTLYHVEQVCECENIEGGEVSITVVPSRSYTQEDKEIDRHNGPIRRALSLGKDLDADQEIMHSLNIFSNLHEQLPGETIFNETMELAYAGCYWTAPQGKILLMLAVRSCAVGTQAMVDTILENLPRKYNVIQEDLKGLPEKAPATQSTPAAPDEPWPTSTGSACDNDALPEMTGFEVYSLGANDCFWSSSTYVLSDRDLRVGEKVHVWATDPIDGRILKTVSLIATDKNNASTIWPAELVKAIQADDTLINGSVLLQAGHLSTDAELSENTSPPTSAIFTGSSNVEKSQVDRLWAFTSHCNMFSNLPFKANQVAAIRLPNENPPKGGRVCVQVRHRTSQHLYESHLFEPAPDIASNAWSQSLCEFLNLQSSMLRAGKLESDGISIVAAEQDNQLWIPQLSELSVDLQFVTWVDHCSFTSTSALDLDQTVRIAVHDDITGAPLPGSPFTFHPSAVTRAQNEWPSALASQLAASPLAQYFKLQQSNDGSTETGNAWRCLRAGVPLRIWMSEPLATPEWSNRFNEAINEVLEACLDSAPIELAFDSHDSHTGCICHHSKLILPAFEASLDQAGRREELKRCVTEHFKKHGIFWFRLNTRVPQATSLTLDNWFIDAATSLQLKPSVTTTATDTTYWVDHGSFTATSDLDLDQEVLIAVHDGLTGAPLPGSPLTFRPGAEACAKARWPSALATQLATSPLAQYLKLQQPSGDSTEVEKTWRCWRADAPLRIWMSEPLATPEWWSYSDPKINHVLHDAVKYSPVQLIIEIHDARTGYPCHRSVLALPSYESSTPDATRTAELKRSIIKHLKENGISWFRLNATPSANYKYKNNWVIEQAASLQLRFAVKILPPHENFYSYTPPQHPSILCPAALTTDQVREQQTQALTRSSSCGATTLSPECIQAIKAYYKNNKEAETQNKLLHAIYDLLALVFRLNRPDNNLPSDWTSLLGKFNAPWHLFDLLKELSLLDNQTASQEKYHQNTPATNKNLVKIPFSTAPDLPINIQPLPTCSPASLEQLLKDFETLDSLLHPETTQLQATNIITELENSVTFWNTALPREMDISHSRDDMDDMDISSSRDDMDDMDDKGIRDVYSIESLPWLWELESLEQYYSYTIDSDNSPSLSDFARLHEVNEYSEGQLDAYEPPEIFSLYTTRLGNFIWHTPAYERLINHTHDHITGHSKKIEPLLSGATLTSANFIQATLHPANRPPLYISLLLDQCTIDQGFTFISCRADNESLAFELHAPYEPQKTVTTARIMVGTTSPLWLWKKIQSCTTHTYPNLVTSSTDTLCVDLGNTHGSELFSSTPSHFNGVAAQTGLYQTHYPFAKISSLSGNTPVIDLGLSYSALRANEGGLGDGWALNFSSYDNRKRRLALSNGIVEELSHEDIKTLQQSTDAKLVRHGYTIKNAIVITKNLGKDAGNVDYNAYELTSLTIEHMNGHEEILGLPQSHDSLESGTAYKASVIDLYKTAISNIREALKELETPSKDAPPLGRIFGTLFFNYLGYKAGKKIDQREQKRSTHAYSLLATAFSTMWGAGLLKSDLEKFKKVKASRENLRDLKSQLELQLEDYKREALILVPLELKADSRSLDLAWQGVKGHVRLISIKDGDTVLLQANHSAEPILQGNQKSIFTLWPQTDECCYITLDIEDCLLRSLTRSSTLQTNNAEQRLDFQYTWTPKLDNVLSSVAENDGSREVVEYDWANSKSLPRVTLHTIAPGGGQPNMHHAWIWEGENTITAATRYEPAPVGSDLQQVPFTRWEWSHSADGRLQLDRLIEEVPGEQRRTTRHVYQTDNTLPEPLRQPQQTEQRITVEDLHATPIVEEQQP